MYLIEKIEFIPQSYPFGREFGATKDFRWSSIVPPLPKNAFPSFEKQPLIGYAPTKSSSPLPICKFNCLLALRHALFVYGTQVSEQITNFLTNSN